MHTDPTALDLLNSASPARARELLTRCCGSTHWVREMVARRPFGDEAELEAAAASIADTLTRDDWLEAFSHHPRIGDRNVLRARFDPAGEGGWARVEQGGLVAVSEQLLDELAAANRDYETRFGFIFLVCATGRSAAEMLALLRKRLPNDPADEWRVAAAEQRKITTLRIAKLLTELQEKATTT